MKMRDLGHFFVIASALVLSTPATADDAHARLTDKAELQAVVRAVPGLSLSGWCRS